MTQNCGVISHLRIWSPIQIPNMRHGWASASNEINLSCPSQWRTEATSKKDSPYWFAVDSVDKVNPKWERRVKFAIPSSTHFNCRRLQFAYSYSSERDQLASRRLLRINDQGRLPWPTIRHRTNHWSPNLLDEPSDTNDCLHSSSQKIYRETRRINSEIPSEVCTSHSLPWYCSSFTRSTNYNQGGFCHKFDSLSW